MSLRKKEERSGKVRIILSLSYVAKLPIAPNSERIDFKRQMTLLSALARFIKQTAGADDCDATKNATLGSAISLCISLHYICFLDLDISIKLCRILCIIAIGNCQDHQLQNWFVTRSCLAGFQFRTIQKREEDSCLQLKSIFPGTLWKEDIVA